MDANERIAKALAIAMRSGGVDGEHHKMWVIDQMVRVLTDCPLEQASAIDANGNLYAYERQGESDEYRAWVAEHNAGDEGADTYDWDEGIAP